MADVERRLSEPAPPEPDLQTVLFAKVVLALMLDQSAGPAGAAPGEHHPARRHPPRHPEGPAGLAGVPAAVYRMSCSATR